MRRTIAALGGRSVLKNKKKKVTQLKKKGRKKVTQLKKEKKGHSAQNKGERVTQLHRGVHNLLNSTSATKSFQSPSLVLKFYQCTKHTLLYG